MHFHRDLLSDGDRALTERDRGMALCRSGGEAAAAEALPLLEAAVRARPDDLAALECKGEVLGRLRRPEEGLAAYKVVLAADPRLGKPRSKERLTSRSRPAGTRCPSSSGSEPSPSIPGAPIITRTWRWPRSRFAIGRPRPRRAGRPSA